MKNSLLQPAVLVSTAFHCLLLNWCWQTCNTFAPLFDSPGSVYFWRLYGYFMFIPCVLSVATWKWMTKQIVKPYFPLATATMMVLGTLSHIAFALSPGLTSSFVFLAFAGLINTVGSYCMILICITLIATMPGEFERRSVIVFALAFKLLLYLLIDNLPIAAGYLSVVLMPIGFAWFAKKGLQGITNESSSDIAPDKQTRTNKPTSVLEKLGIPAYTLLFLIALPFCIEYMRETVVLQAGDASFSSNSVLIAMTLLFVMATALVELFAISKGKPSLIPIAVSAILTVGFLLSISTPYINCALALMYACFFLYRMVFYGILSNWAAKSMKKVILITSVGMMCDVVGHTAGMMLGSNFVGLFELAPGLPSAVIYLVAIASTMLFFILHQNNTALAGSTKKAPVSQTPVERDTLKDVIDCSVSILSETYGLTAREASVLKQIVLNKSYTQIAELLVISPNTVKTHQKHIYQKLGIHAADEVFPLLEKAYNRRDEPN